jgi:hypothetical protein
LTSLSGLTDAAGGLASPARWMQAKLLGLGCQFDGMIEGNHPIPEVLLN